MFKIESAYTLLVYWFRYNSTCAGHYEFARPPWNIIEVDGHKTDASTEDSNIRILDKWTCDMLTCGLKNALPPTPPIC